MNNEAKSRKIYTKALDNFNNGNIDKALDLCEKSISMDLKNNSAINLKGLLYYLKGDLISCKNLWKMNYHTNKDTVSYKYLQDAKLDEQFLKKYANAITLIKNNDVEGAIDLLKQCEKTDFNHINVCNNLAMCYIKLGKYNNALEYYEKALSIDKNNDISINIKKELYKKGLIKKYKGKKILIAILVISIISSISIYLFNKFNKTKNISEMKNNKITSKESKNKSNIPKKEEAKKTETKKQEIKKEEKIDIQNLNNYIEKKNYIQLYNIYSNYKNKNLDVNSKSVLVKAEKLLKEEGVEYFYNTAMVNTNNKKYKESNDLLLKAYSLGNVNYLYPHIIYLLATNYEAVNNISEAIRYYEIYVNSFMKNDYGDLALYKLATLNEKVDDAKSKNYAKKLSQIYPQSMYNNSNIKRIINNN
ncbi:tetratricopeptide repeat protein [Clostridium botulinum]|uniref:tetratricopeptide repeat protein n=1 Tax=Clostridium botulinum TaxID=1491 RepID=UPI00099CD49A|nr:tetratricopeptide repeat protein [Clostridium botulinum]NFK36274.1 tetratricopeptide repeat protein [Clostridium botulinum H04402 065]NFB16671.1 tetratricopeptide repeat protein [Clostridium botulinum]NFB66881.1 tetratricopeptide repeat protein [Clostridium botulinum]NFB97340.1 tetratricopeptide repeat protein [Clostridium botulinum]NFC58710.1 tetratricopeptide repeat protein [Clostridium botulinum]